MPDPWLEMLDWAPRAHQSASCPDLPERACSIPQFLKTHYAVLKLSKRLPWFRWSRIERHVMFKRSWNRSVHAKLIAARLSLEEARKEWLIDRLAGI